MDNRNELLSALEKAAEPALRYSKFELFCMVYGMAQMYNNIGYIDLEIFGPTVALIALNVLKNSNNSPSGVKEE